MKLCKTLEGGQSIERCDCVTVYMYTYMYIYIVYIHTLTLLKLCRNLGGGPEYRKV